MNRGIAKRPLFETRGDMRFFLARLARQIRLNRIEVHSYCLMLTHFHLLARSPIGELSEAMRRVQNDYSRRFNRRNRRDGPLIRGRFLSRLVGSLSYRHTLVRYIDANPVKAGIVQVPAQYEFGSAAAYERESFPPWLSRGWIESRVLTTTGQDLLTPANYRATFGVRDANGYGDLFDLVEARIAHNGTKDPLGDLIGTAPEHVQAWMRRKSKLADGHRIGQPVCGALTLLRVLNENVEQQGTWLIEDGPRVLRGVEIAQSGLLRELCGLSWTEIACFDNGSVSRASRLGGIHRRLFDVDPIYARRVAAVSGDVIRCCAPQASQVLRGTD